MYFCECTATGFYGIIPGMEKKGDSNDGKKAIISISLRRTASRDVLSGVFRHLETSSG